MNKIILYTSSFCGYCSAAKSLLEKKGMYFEEVDISSDPLLRKEILDKWNWRTLPLLIVNNRLIGGYRELVSLDSQNKLDKFQI